MKCNTFQLITKHRKERPERQSYRHTRYQASRVHMPPALLVQVILRAGQLTVVKSFLFRGGSFDPLVIVSGHH